MKLRSPRRKTTALAAAARGPVLEMLEGRRMLSVSVLRGILTINGTAGDDTITLSRDPVTKGLLRISINGLTNGVDEVGLKQINISGLEGNDLILIDQSQGAIALTVNAAG